MLFEEHCTINNRLLNSQEFSGLGESEKAKKEPSRYIHICRSRKSRILLVDTLGFLRHPPLQKKIHRPMLDLHILPLQSLSATLTRHSYCSLKNLQAHTMLKRHTCDWYLWLLHIEQKANTWTVLAASPPTDRASDVLQLCLLSIYSTNLMPRPLCLIWYA